MNFPRASTSHTSGSGIGRIPSCRGVSRRAKHTRRFCGPVEFPPAGAHRRPVRRLVQTSRRPCPSTAARVPRTRRLRADRRLGVGPQQPDTPIAVEIYDGETLLITVTANRMRLGLSRGSQGERPARFPLQDAPFVERRPDTPDPRQDRGRGIRAGEVSTIAPVPGCAIAIASTRELSPKAARAPSIPRATGMNSSGGDLTDRIQQR